ncbi:hypothetical protein GOP47_0011152 [Adiantum capillus-veneris]|uniref:Uncharacterized protein n=1 Tax=Adiantum capillus-veneris TaxID=13818 RepID=A0A9D4USN3_ADICA|nr:hypothetical protein GOP47_0011152 [Adiantum capillus-veneris]
MKETLISLWQLLPVAHWQPAIPLRVLPFVLNRQAAAATAGDEDHRPLLLWENPYFDGCSSYLVEHRKSASKDAPKKELSLIAFMVLCNKRLLACYFS